MAGLVLVTLSLIAAFVSIGAPGLGWMLAAAILVLGSLFNASTGILSKALVLIVSLAHLLSVGPLAGGRLDHARSIPAVFLIVLVIVPFVVATLALLSSRGDRSSSGTSRYGQSNQRTDVPTCRRTRR